MTDTPDAELLEQFARHGSESAFNVLVERYVALVHSVALRHVANSRDAQDITQAVFIVLARKAGTFGHKTVLPGWLYRTAQLTAANFQRSESHRIRREQEAYMQSVLEEPAVDALWRELSPKLDDAMACLAGSDRDALLLRYFQNKSVAEVGTFLGVEENTAQKRVGRALEKLRTFFARRGVASTTAIIAGAISANSVQAAPAGLAQTISAVAVAKGAAASTSTLTLVKGALKIMAWTKAKTAIVAGLMILIAGGVGVFVARDIQNKSNSFEVEGYVLYKWSKTPQMFKAFVRGNEWLIQTTINTNGILYHEESFDGKYVYTYIQLSEPANGAMNSSIGSVEQDDIPPVTSEVMPIWLAYGAARFFDSVTGSQIRPFLITSGLRQDRDHPLQAEWQRSTNPPFVPSYIYCPQINYRYRVIGFTNFDGLAVPREFAFETFHSDPNLTYSPDYFVHGFLTKIENPKGSMDFRPVLDRRTYVEDWRFPRAEVLGQAASYVNTSGQWLSTNSPQWRSLSKLWDPIVGSLVWPSKGQTIHGIQP